LEWFWIIKSWVDTKKKNIYIMNNDKNKIIILMNKL
jgi:hypothetical protein